MLRRNISGENFIGINQRIDPQSANIIAQLVRARGYNARIIDSKQMKRIYIGNHRKYQRKGRITDIAKAAKNPVNMSRMRSVATSTSGTYDLNTQQRDTEYARWKVNNYRRNPNLRYVALGANPTINQGFYMEPESSRPYLLALGFMPSNVALMYLAELGAPIGPGTDIYSWYASDRNNLGEDWHAANMRQIAWHIKQQYRSATSMAELYDSLTFDGYNLGYKISGSDLEIDTDDGNELAESRNKIFKDELLSENAFGGILSAYTFEGGSALFDMDFRKRAIRLSDWLPDAELYLNQMEIRDLVNNAAYKAQGRSDSRMGEGVGSLMNDARRNPTKSIYLDDKFPTYDRPEPEMYNDFTYDWLNLQKQQWGGGSAGSITRETKLLPYSRPVMFMRNLNDGVIGEKVESLDWIPEMDNALELLRRINAINVAEVEANTQAELSNAKKIVDDAMNVIESYTMLTDQRLGEGAGQDWPKEGFDSGYVEGNWKFRTRGVGFSGTPIDGGDYYSIDERVNRLIENYR